MKNKLENWITNRRADETQIMNLLQEYAIVSDNAVWAKDCDNDLKAIIWLACNKKLLPK
jgi:hypothetical protein